MKKLLLVLTFCALSTTNVRAQTTTNAVDATRNGTVSVADANRQLRKLFSASSYSARQPIDLFKVRYFSRAENGRNVLLSGLVAIPRVGAPKGLVLYTHGTIHDRRLSPSRYDGRNTIPETTAAALLFASGGYAVAVPDYFGMGDDLKNEHPYPLGSLNARSAIDIIAPARRLLARQNVAVGSRLFVTGYSEGGAVAMWTIRVLEKPNSPFAVTKGAPMSGPYDLSGAQRQSLLAPNTNATIFAARLYFLTYALHSFHKNSGIKLTDYLKPAMAFAVARDYKANLSDENLMKRLAVTAVLMRAKNSLANLVTPRFLRAMQTVDTRDPFVRALKSNDASDWSPRAPMLLVALETDQIVLVQNTKNTIRAMRRNGIGANVMRTSIIQNDKLNHVSAVIPALVKARQFFDGGFAAVR